MRLKVKFLVLLCSVSSILVYIIFSGESFVSPREPSLQFLDGRWPSSEEHDFYVQGVLKAEQQQWTTEIQEKWQTEKAKVAQIDTIMKRHENVIRESRPHSQKSGIRKNVIILSPGRSGSSFLGQIFNNNPHVMFWYEPWYTILRKLFQVVYITDKDEPKYYKKTAIEVINSLLQCDFGGITNSTLEAFSNSYFRRKSKALAGASLCPEKCLPFSKTLLAKVCSSYNHTVVKVLSNRLPSLNIQTLKELFKHPDRYEVKIIHLVRDPRAIMHSWVYTAKWIKNYPDPSFGYTVTRICNHTLDNIRFGLISPPPWLKNRFKVIRYEDLVRDAVKIAKELYKFAEIDWSIDVEEWINEHITGKNRVRGTKNPYSLYRNSSAVIEKWKSAPASFIRTVEDSCGGLMNMFGYKKWINKR